MKRDFTWTALWLTVVAVLVQSAEAPRPLVPVALYSIRASDLKGDLSFLASDVLQGRYTPSPGLDVAAEFIASQFRRAGLKPGGDNDYFQTAHMIDRIMPKAATGLEVFGTARTFTIAPESIAILHTAAAAHLDHIPVLVLDRADIGLLNGVNVSGKAIVVSQPEFRSLPRQEAMRAYANWRKFQNVLGATKAALEVVVSANLPDPAPQLITATENTTDQIPRIAITGTAAEQLQSLAASEPGTLSIQIPPPHDEPVTVKNVIAILPGTDSSLKGSYVFVTAHYDHIGTKESGARMANRQSTPNEGDLIYNGANDDGSGTVSVIEIARALAKVTPKPKRSIVFLTFFGEERGELGSAYYLNHPVFPISKTIADVNLEQVGRTDELKDGTIAPQVNTLSITGFDYSTVSNTIIHAGKQLGVKVFKDDEASDAYFTQSDNAAFAEQGIPAHSVSVAYDYPDYHGVGDEWQKIDYENMARIDRVIGLAVLQMANSVVPPRWAESNSKTASFREAQREQSLLNRLAK